MSLLGNKKLDVRMSSLGAKNTDEYSFDIPWERDVYVVGFNCTTATDRRCVLTFVNGEYVGSTIPSLLTERARIRLYALIETKVAELEAHYRDASV